MISSLVSPVSQTITIERTGFPWPRNQTTGSYYGKIGPTHVAHFQGSVALAKQKGAVQSCAQKSIRPSTGGWGVGMAGHKGNAALKERFRVI